MQIDRKKIVMLGVVALMTGGFVIADGLPSLRTLRAKQREVKRLSAQLEKMRTNASASMHTTGSASNTGGTDVTEAEFATAVPEQSHLGPLLEQLSEDLAAEGVTVHQLEAKTIAAGHDFNRIPVSLRFEGTFEALMALLDRVESGPRIIRIDEVIAEGGGAPRSRDITNGASGTIDEPRPIKVEIRLSTFFQSAGGSS